MTGRPPTALLLILLIGLAVCGTGTALFVSAPRLPDVGSVPAAHPAAGTGRGTSEPLPIGVPDGGTAGRDGAIGTVSPAAAGAGAPTRLMVPDLGVTAPIVPVGVRDDGELGVPDDPRVLGWWRGGARPGDPRGTVVVDGHVDDRRIGAGALFRLATLRPGARLALDAGSGPRSYLVRAVRSYPKALLPREVFATGGRPRLVVITCGGAFDATTRQYADNIVAYAVPADR